MKNIKRILSTLLLFYCITATYAQEEQVKISGIVKDNTGEPLIGVTVVAKNQPGFGTITDIDGKFSFKTGTYSVLVFSSVGFETIEVPVLQIKDRDNLSVKMVENTQILDAVVVTGSGLQKKQTVTGAFTTVDIGQLNSPTPNLTNSLAGVVPGIIAVQTSGEPGENMSEFWIRGVSTFGAKSGALVLVDGIERSFNEIPVEDIETFSVLKDASATAIYGQRGANGVVLVTTKRGEKGKPKINAKLSFGLNTLTKTPEYTDALTYARMANEALRGRYESPLYSDSELDIIQHRLDPDLFPNVDWRNLLLKDNSETYNANVNVSGGGDNMTYFVSLGYVKEGGIYKTESPDNEFNNNASYERINYRSNVNINLTKSTEVKVGIGGWLVNRIAPVIETNDIWNSFNKFTPLTFPRRYSTGQWPAETPEVLMTQSGYKKIWNNKMETNIEAIQGLDFITEGLTISGLLSFDTYNENNLNRRKKPEIWIAQNYRASNGELILRKINDAELMKQTSETKGDKRYYMEAKINYSRLFDEKHRVGVFAMAYQQEFTNTDSSDNILASIPKRNLAYSGRFTYAFQDRYLAELNWGYTGSENFEKNKRFGFFPAVSAGWVISEEPLIKQVAPWLDMFKVRASYGEVGNDVIDDKRFPYLTIIGTSNGNYSFGEFGSNTINGYRLQQIGTPNLTWEVAKKYNLGFDFAFLNNKISGAFDIFKDKRDHIFMKRGFVPMSTGLQDRAPMANVGKMQSNGVDGNISFSEKINKVGFTVRANMTYQNNEIIDKDEAANELWYRMDRGFRQDQTRGYIALGLFENDADIASSPTQTFGGKPVLPGDIKYKDVNGDGKIDEDDKVPLGYRKVPGLQYGMGFSIQWNNFDFSVLFQGAGRRDFFVNGDGVFAFNSENQGNILKLMADGNRWIPKEVSGRASTENPNAEWPRLTYGENKNNSQESTFWLKDGTYLRLKNIDISYNVPKTFLRKFQISNLKVGFIGQNLHTWSKFKWWDPESGQSSGSNYPITKNYSMYLQVGF